MHSSIVINTTYICIGCIGAHGARETPDPIPNSAVKPRSGYNTTLWEDSTVPNYSQNLLYGRFFLF
jgi:hypothetical protein